MIVESTLFMRNGDVDAWTFWPFIVVRPSHRNDAALIAHEMVHYRRQAWWSPVWLLLYKLSKSFRLREEVLGFRAQVALGGLSASSAAHLLVRAYGLRITYEEALYAIEAALLD